MLALMCLTFLLDNFKILKPSRNLNLKYLQIYIVISFELSLIQKKKRAVFH